jgi:hypothetical protein
MKKAARNSLIAWGIITGLIVLQFIWIYSRHGLPGFKAFMQEAIYTHIPITLASVALTWLLLGLFLALMLTGRIAKATSLTWIGFFALAVLYLNMLRERVRYGDIDYYTQAAFALVRDKPLPDTYFYPPLWATLLSFLTPLGEDGILLVAWMANILSFLLFYLLLVRTLERYEFRPYAAALTAFMFLLVNMPVLRTFMYVQVNFHVMNFILLSLLLHNDRRFLSACMLALAVHFKASPAFLGLAFLLQRDWKWLLSFALSMLLIAAIPFALYGGGPYVDFLNNFLFINAPHALSLHDSSFDSAIGMALSYFRADFSEVRILVLLAKAVTAVAVIYLSVCTRGYVSDAGGKIHLFDSIVPLFVGMTLLSPLVWEHHAIFLTLPVLLLLKKLESPAEWIGYGVAYFLIFLIPVFDYFPWSYGRLLGMLILLVLLWKVRARTSNTFFPTFNAWSESLLLWKAPTRAA